MFSRKSTGSSTVVNSKYALNLSLNELIIYYINNNKLTELKEILDKNNVNNIIDDKIKYRALDFAIKYNNKDIIKYIISLGADPYILNGSNKNAFDMSKDYMNNDVVIHFLNTKDDIIKNNKKEITTLEKKISDLEASKAFMLRSIDTLNNKNSTFNTYVAELKYESTTLKENVSSLTMKTRSMDNKINTLSQDAVALRTENSVLKSSVNILRIENDDLKKENTTLKRKYSNLEESFDNLLKSTKSKK